MIALFLIIIMAISYLVHSYYVLARHNGIVDTPNQRSMHDKPIKKAAGILFVTQLLVGIWIYYLFWGQQDIELPTLILWTLGCLFAMILGFIDDIYNLRSYIKLIVELLVVTPAAIYFIDHLHILEFSIRGPIAGLLFALYIIFFMNLCNFMDGLDLYLSLNFFIGLIIFLFWNSTENHLQHILIYALIPISSMIGFFRYNYPPARVFMGDSGSLAIGFIAALLPFLFIKTQADIELSHSFFFFPVIWIDGVLTILLRLANKENILLAHRKHLYQRICQHWHKKQASFRFSLANFAIVPFIYFYRNGEISLNQALAIGLAGYITVYIFLSYLYDLSIRKENT